MNQTIFHKILAGEIPCHKVYESESVLAFLDIAPCTVGHTLVIPKHAIGTSMMDDPSPMMLGAMLGAVHGIAPRIVKVVGADGFNLIMNNGPAAGQAVPYPHVHIIPRRAGDGLQHWPKIERTQEELAQDAARIMAAIA